MRNSHCQKNLYCLNFKAYPAHKFNIQKNVVGEGLHRDNRFWVHNEFRLVLAQIKWKANKEYSKFSHLGLENQLAESVERLVSAHICHYNCVPENEKVIKKKRCISHMDLENGKSQRRVLRSAQLLVRTSRQEVCEAMYRRRDFQHS